MGTWQGVWQEGEECKQNIGDGGKERKEHSGLQAEGPLVSCSRGFLAEFSEQHFIAPLTLGDK